MIIDSGASSSLTSVMALEDLAHRQLEMHGELDIKIDPNDTTRFRFGNGDRAATLSRADVGTMAGGEYGVTSMQTLDTGDKYVPMLCSNEFLQKAGAIIDFETGEMMLKHLDRNVIVKLERASSGHLLLDLCGDLLSQAGRSTGVDLRRFQQVREAPAQES